MFNVHFTIYVRILLSLSTTLVLSSALKEVPIENREIKPLAMFAVSRFTVCLPTVRSSPDLMASMDVSPPTRLSLATISSLVALQPPLDAFVPMISIVFHYYINPPNLHALRIFFFVRSKSSSLIVGFQVTAIKQEAES
ncbi:hypothetical protein V6Z12_D04G222800 [Gossypium hirsutum]